MNELRDGVSLPAVADRWLSRLSLAEAPNPLSARDGKLLKLVPKDIKLNKEAAAELLTQALHSNPALREALSAGSESSPRRRDRARLALMRSALYFEGGHFTQALKVSRNAPMLRRPAAHWP